jgi:hypothetical protein
MFVKRSEELLTVVHLFVKGRCERKIHIPEFRRMIHL